MFGFIVTKCKFIVKKNSLTTVFSPIFVADTKIISVYNLVNPLNNNITMKIKSVFKISFFRFSPDSVRQTPFANFHTFYLVLSPFTAIFTPLHSLYISFPHCPHSPHSPHSHPDFRYSHFISPHSHPYSPCSLHPYPLPSYSLHSLP